MDEMTNYQQKINQQMQTYNDTVNSPESEYPALARAATPLPQPVAPILGRDDELNELRLNLRNPEKANVILLGDPGSGKTALVQGFTHDANSTQYLTLSVDVERLAKDTDGDKDSEIANGLLDLVHETTSYSKSHDVIVSLFMDEFHRISMLSPSSVEALKPILEKSAQYGIRIIAATTFEEYDKWIAPNRALDQRLLRMDLPELSRKAVINVLKSRAKRYNALDLADPKIFGEIYDVSRQYLPSNSQPRASIDILLNMVGNITKMEYMKNGKLHREYSSVKDLNLKSDYQLSRPMLNRVIQRSYGIDIDNIVDIKEVKKAIRSKIFNQTQAVEMIISRLEMSLAGFNDPTRPKLSFLSTGPTGTGKACRDDELIPVPTKEGYKLNGDLKVGDKVFNRHGKPVMVTGVYHKGYRNIYRMTLKDGRTIDTAADHLWNYKTSADKHWKTGKTIELMHRKLKQFHKNGLPYYPYVIPQNDAVERPACDEAISPYQVGVHLAMDNKTTKIPNAYKNGSIKQRWALIQGIFDTNGHITNGNNYVLTYQGGTVAFRQEIQEVLWSLGIKSKLRNNLLSSGDFLRVYVANNKKPNFFAKSVNLDIANQGRDSQKRVTQYQQNAIVSIEKLDKQVPMTCIMVNDDEHLYLVGKEYIVTHNTELAKVITTALNIPLKRFDMSRYPRPEDAVEFANELALAAWSSPNAYILIDEAEKSTKQCMNTLLQVLDDARLTAANNSNRVISFGGNIINLTTNLGSEVFQHAQRFNPDSDSSYMDTDLIYKSLSDAPEFETAVLGRIDAIIPFKALPKIAIYQIAKRQLDKDLVIAENNHRPIFVSPDVLPYIVIDRTSNDSEHGGARDAKRNVKNIVIQQLSHYLAEGRPDCPLIIRLDATPRFRDSRITDTRAAGITVDECYPKDMVDRFIKQLSQKVGRPILDAGLYIPKTWSSQDIVNHLLPLIKKGVTSFKTTVDETKVLIIDGKASLDVANDYSYISKLDAESLAQQKREAQQQNNQ